MRDKEDEVTVADKNAFLKEAEIMKRFSDPWHPNVIRLLGVITQSEPLMIITEFLSNGDLQSFLRKNRPQKGKFSGIAMCDLVYMAADISSGMAFLSSQKFIHRYNRINHTCFDVHMPQPTAIFCCYFRNKLIAEVKIFMVH